MVTQPKNADEAAAMIAAGMDFQRKEAERALKEETDRLKPVIDFAASDAFREIQARAEELRVQFAGDTNLETNLRLIGPSMDRIATELARRGVVSATVDAPDGND